MTTQDGLWRYRFDDVVQVAGFDPRDGQPLIRYVERRQYVVPHFTPVIQSEFDRAAASVVGEVITAKQLQNAILSFGENFGDILEFTAEIDDRRIPHAYAFFVEVDSESSFVSTWTFSYITSRV